jgi:hypothetical protein
MPSSLPSLDNDDMTFTAQLDELVTALRHTRSRLLAPLDFSQHQLPRDPAIFVEDVLQYVMDEWGADLRRIGHVLEEDTSWNDTRNHYPRYTLRIVGGGTAQLHFTGEYPRALHLTISKGFRAANQFSDARQLKLDLPITTDPNVLLISLLNGLKDAAV